MDDARNEGVPLDTEGQPDDGQEPETPNGDTDDVTPSGDTEAAPEEEPPNYPEEDPEFEPGAGDEPEDAPATNARGIEVGKNLGTDNPNF